MKRVIPEDRERHMAGVAEYMYNHAEKYDLIPEKMYVLGMLHDVGYIFGKPNHEVRGAEILRLIGLSPTNDLVHAVACHGLTPFEYMMQFGATLDEIPKEIILLWEADMHVDLTGEDVGYSARLADVVYRYGEDSKPYEICSETIEFLKDLEKNK